MGFVWGTIIVVLAIFALFFYGAYHADKVVEAKAAAKRLEAQAKASGKSKKN